VEQTSDQLCDAVPIHGTQKLCSHKSNQRNTEQQNKVIMYLYLGLLPSRTKLFIFHVPSAVMPFLVLCIPMTLPLSRLPSVCPPARRNKPKHFYGFIYTFFCLRSLNSSTNSNVAQNLTTRRHTNVSAKLTHA
jgi:hypothetical protein